MSAMRLTKFLGPVGVLGALVEIGAHPCLQVDRLADIDDGAVLVLHQVAAGLVGQGFEDRFKVVWGCHSGIILT